MQHQRRGQHQLHKLLEMEKWKLNHTQCTNTPLKRRTNASAYKQMHVPSSPVYTVTHGARRIMQLLKESITNPMTCLRNRFSQVIYVWDAMWYGLYQWGFTACIIQQLESLDSSNHQDDKKKKKEWKRVKHAAERRAAQCITQQFCTTKLRTASIGSIKR